MSNVFWSKKLKYVHVALNEKFAQWNEKHAHNRVEELKQQIMQFKDMGCFGQKWECGHFYEYCACRRKTCPLQKLNEAYVNALYVWNRARKTLSQTNSLANAVREDMGIRKAR